MHKEEARGGHMGRSHCCYQSQGIAGGSSSSSGSSSDTKPNQPQKEDPDPDSDPDPDPADTTQGKVTTAPNESPEDNPLFNWKFLIFVPVLLVALLLLCCCWKLCCRKVKSSAHPSPCPGSHTHAPSSRSSVKAQYYKPACWQFPICSKDLLASRRDPDS